MRIVHEVYSKSSASVGIKPYAIAKDHKKSTGIVVNLLILNEDQSEEINIEGDGACILEVLEHIVKTIKSMGKEMVKKDIIVENWDDVSLKGSRFKK